MRHRSVADLMTPRAVSVQRGTAFKEIARLLDEFGITALPVVDESDVPWASSPKRTCSEARQATPQPIS